MNSIIFNKNYIHKKTKKCYKVSSKIAINCTEKSSEINNVIYTDGRLIFIREYREFISEFEPEKDEDKF